MKSKTCKIALSFVISLFIVITSLFAYTMLFDGNYLELSEKVLEYEDLFDDLTNVRDFGYVFYDFSQRGIKLSGSKVENIFRNTDYITLPKIKGKVLAMFITKKTAVAGVNFNAISEDSDDENPSQEALEYWKKYSNGIYEAYVFKLFGNYYIKNRIKAESDSTIFGSDTFYVCKVSNKDSFSEIDNLSTNDRTYYFYDSFYPKVKIKWIDDIRFRLLICASTIALATSFYFIISILKSKYSKISEN